MHLSPHRSVEGIQSDTPVTVWRVDRNVLKTISAALGMVGDFKRLKVSLLPSEVATRPAPVQLDDGLTSVFAEQRTDGSAGILIIGSGKTGKKTLAALLRRRAHNDSLRIYSTSSLPLPLDAANHARAFDYVVLVVNMLDAYSLEVATEALSHIVADAIFGRIVIVCTHADHVSSYNILPETLESLASTFQIPILYGDLMRSNGEELAARILKLCLVASGRFARDGATPAAVSSAEPLLVTSTQL